MIVLATAPNQAYIMQQPMMVPMVSLQGQGLVKGYKQTTPNHQCAHRVALRWEGFMGLTPICACHAGGWHG